MAHQRSKNNAAEAVDVRRVRAISITQSTLAASSDSGATRVPERSYAARGSRLPVLKRASDKSSDASTQSSVGLSRVSGGGASFHFSVDRRPRDTEQFHDLGLGVRTTVEQFIQM